MSASGAAHAHTRSLRVVTYNIHKGVQGVWPSQRLEIHNLQHAIASLHADVVCLQEVRKLNRKDMTDHDGRAFLSRNAQPFFNLRFHCSAALIVINKNCPFPDSHVFLLCNLRND